MRRSHSVRWSTPKNSSRLMFSMLFRNQISTQNSTHAGKYFHKSEAEHEHTGTSEGEITCSVDLQKYYEKVERGHLNDIKKGIFEVTDSQINQISLCCVICGKSGLKAKWNIVQGMQRELWWICYLPDIPTRCTFSLCFFIYTPPPPTPPSHSPSLQWTVTGLKSHLCFSHISAHGWNIRGVKHGEGALLNLISQAGSH